MEAEQETNWVLPDTFGARLRRVRHKMGWSQAELAEACGLKDGSIATWERHARVVGLAEPAAQIADAVGCDVMWLLYGTVQGVRSPTWDTMLPPWTPCPDSQHWN